MKLSLLPLAALTLCLAHLQPASAAPGDGAPQHPLNQPPLKLNAQNTVIVDATDYAGNTLQHYLIKYFGTAATAAEFLIDGPATPARRAANPEFPLVRNAANLQIADDKVIIAVGPTRYLDPADKVRLESFNQNGAILLKRQGNVIVIAGSPFNNQWAGSLNGVSEFLNRVCGIRLYAPDDLWASRPKTREISVDQLNFFRVHPFLTTYLAPLQPRNLQWARINGTANRLTINTNHNLANIFPPDKYGKSHPEIYEMRGGERRVPANLGTKIWNPSLVAPSLPDLAMDHIREKMKAQPNTRYISLGMMDVEFDDETPEAQESVRKFGDYSNLYYEFLNKVARQASKEFPDLILTSFAYSNARKPPVGIKIEPNIAVKVVTKLYNGTDPAYVDFELARIRGFAEAGAQWFIHDWAFSGVTPRQNLHQYARFLQWGKQNGMLGAYIEWTPGESWYLEGGQYWILTQLLADPYQDVDLLWKTYCQDMYGPGAETMFDFFQTFQTKSVFAPDLIEVRDLPRQEPALYTVDDLARQRSLLVKAEALTATDPLIQERLTKVNRYFRAHELFALAVHTPHRLDWEFNKSGRTGINKELLAFYAQDDAKRLDEAIHYYAVERTQPPDSNAMEVQLGMPTSYVNNYTRGLSRLLRGLRAQATAGVDLDAPGPAKADRIKVATHKLLRDNLPAKINAARVKTFEDILAKSLWIPTTVQTPTIDGDLSDPAWKSAAPLTGFSSRDTLRDSKHQTTGKIVRVGDKLAIAISANQDGPIWAQSPRETLTGTHIWRESGVEFFFGPPAKTEAENPPYAQFVVNVLGAYRGFGTAKDIRDGVEVATRLDEKAGTFTIEVALPLKTDKYDYTREPVLTFNAVRNVFTRNSYEADVLLGWYPVFYTATVSESRGLVFLK